MINIATILKHNVIGKLLNHLIVFCINIMIVRILGAAGSGVYFNELYVLNFVAFLFSAGLDYAAISMISQQPALLPVVNRMLLLVVFFFASVITLYSLVLLPDFNNYFRQPALAIVLFSVGNLLLIFFQGVLSALRKFNLQNLVLGTTNLVFLTWLFFGLREGQTGNEEKIFLAYGALFFLQGLIIFSCCLRKPQARAGSISWNQFIRQGIYIMISSLVYFAFLRIDNFFVEKYEDDVTLGIYVQCGKIGQYFLYFSSIISSTLLPFIATETVGASYKAWVKMMKPYLVLICVAAVGIAATGKFVFPLLFGESFQGMYKIMLILLPGFVCLGMLTLLNAVYIGKGNIRRIFVGDVMGLLLVTSFDSLLIPSYGVYAAAIISSVVYCIVFLYLLAGFKKQFDLPQKNIPGS